ncbi:MAG: DUF1287 domain-containing protein [Oscillospiraceae bacterium]
MVKQKRKKRLALLGCLVLAALAALCFARAYHLLPERTYTAEDFGIPVAVSPVDFNGNGVDDYADLVLGARQDAKNHPRYDGAYQPGGYPPDDIGVCTDVIWRAFRQAGYCLRDMVDADIAARPAAYPQITAPDSDIDFRRVPNLHCFFAAYGQALTCDTTQIDQWQPGDIVIFGRDTHIGILSDRRNRDGRAYVIHNGGQPRREEDYFARNDRVTAHYRFDPTSLPDWLKLSWQAE